jgi:hypothetical protein
MVNLCKLYGCKECYYADQTAIKENKDQVCTYPLQLNVDEEKCYNKYLLTARLKELKIGVK